MKSAWNFNQIVSAQCADTGCGLLVCRFINNPFRRCVAQQTQNLLCRTVSIFQTVLTADTYPRDGCGAVCKEYTAAEKLIELMSIAPANRFFGKSGLSDGSDADFCIFDLDAQFTVDPADFLSKGKATPFEKDKIFGVCKLTVCNGETAYISR